MRSLLLCAALLLLPLAAGAQAPADAPVVEPTPTETPREPADPGLPPGFERIEGPAESQVPIEATPLVVIAYLFIWAVTFAYLFALWRRQRRMNEELELLAKRLEQAALE